jgi:uncharacterized membrane protein YadS
VRQLSDFVKWHEKSAEKMWLCCTETPQLIFGNIACEQLYKGWQSDTEVCDDLVRKRRYGLTYEVWGLVYGIIVCNLFGAGKMPRWMGSAAKGEDYIKVGLVLLGLDMQTIGALAGPSLITSWVVTPIVVMFSYGVVAHKVLGLKRSSTGTRSVGTPNSDEAADDARKMTPSLALMLSCGLAVCGSSAASDRFEF